MIKNMWSTPMGFGKMPEEFALELTNNLFSLGDPSKYENIFSCGDKLPIVSEFKEKYVIPSFNNYLKNTLDKSIDDWNEHRVNGWVVSYSSNTSMDYHNHRGSQLSAVFYLMCDENDKGGGVRFNDPRSNANRGYDRTFIPWFDPHNINPSIGDIVIFPSFVYHSVSTYRDNIRMAIPVDLFLYTGKNT
jgi:hypothetical protein